MQNDHRVVSIVFRTARKNRSNYSGVCDFVENVLTPADLRLHLADYLRRVSREHERFVVVEGDTPIAELRPIREAPMLKDLPRILAEAPLLTKEEADSFAADIEKARAYLNSMPAHNPWE